MPFRHDTESRTWQVTPDLLCIATAEGKLMQTNPAWTRTLGYSREDIESSLFFQFVHPDDLATTAMAFADLRLGKPVLNFVNRYRHKDGSYRWLSWNSVPEDGVYFASARDITDFKEAESALAHHMREAVLREQFISILGHDLRNPLAGAACAVEYLRDREALSDNGHRALDTAGQSLRRMSQLIDDILDFARARLGGDLGIAARPCDTLREVLEQTVREISVAHPAVQIDEAYSFTDPVTCDTARIAQLVSNLLGNAVFHGTSDAPIRLEAKDAGTDVMISVTNQGGTIPPEVLPRLFHPFQRHEPGNSQNGLGLGLYIADQIARGHGGDLSVLSGGGETRFTLRLPRRGSVAPGLPGKVEPLVTDTGSGRGPLDETAGNTPDLPAARAG